MNCKNRFPNTNRRLIALLLALLVALSPFVANAEEQCDALNPRACLDQGVYTFYMGIAATVWSFDRTLLVLAYQLDHLRWWLANQAFLVAYAAIRSIAIPLLNPSAMLAIIIGLLLFLLVPVLGRINLINIRQALIWLLIAPLLLSEAGTWMLELERLRTSVAGQISSQIGVATAQGLFGGGSDSVTDRVNLPTALYPVAGTASPCGSATITRPQADTDDPGIRMDDLAAALLLANAQDIHCPAEDSPISILPDGFEGVFTVAGGIENRDATDRAIAIANLQQGITRLLLAIVACLLAVGEMLIQLAFTLGLVVVWLCLPLVAVLILFSDTLRPLGMLVQRMLSITLTAWVVSAILALISVCLLGAAASGSATALIALSFGGLFVFARLLIVAFTTLTDTFTSISSIAGTSTTIALTGAVAAVGSIAQHGARLAGTALNTTSDIAQGSLKAVVGAGIAARALRNGSAAIGDIRPLAPVGTLAASMGLTAEEATTKIASEHGSDLSLPHRQRNSQ